MHPLYKITLVILLFVQVHYVSSIADFPVTKYPLLAPAKNTTNYFNVGLIGSFGSHASPGLLRYMVEVLNQDLTILPNVLFRLYRCDLTLGDKAKALLAAQTLINTYNVSALIGGLVSDETEIAQLVASIYQVPQIAATPTSPALSDKVSYPFLARVNPPAQYQNDALLDLMARKNWRQAFVMYSNDDYGTAGFNSLQSKTLRTNVTIQSTSIVTAAKNYSGLIPLLQAAIDTYRVRIFVCYAQPGDCNLVIQTLTNASTPLLGPTTVNTFIVMYAGTLTFLTSPAQYNLNLMPWYQGVVGICSRGPAVGTALYENLNIGWNAANATLFPGSRPNLGPVWYYADAMYSFAHAVEANLAKGKTYSNISGADLMSTMVQLNFSGVTGLVNYDHTYDRPGDFVWFNFQPGQTFTAKEIAAYYSPATSTTYFDQNNLTLIFNGMANPPDGSCNCVHGSCDLYDKCTCLDGWSGDACNTYAVIHEGSGGFDTGGIVAVVVAPVVAFALILIFAILFVRYKRRRMIKDLSEQQRSLIKREDIAMHDRLGRGAAGEVFRGMFRGTEVAVKKLLASATSQAAVEQFEIETAIMTSLRHPNIVLFMGVCLMPENNEMLLVMELMNKGSLHDIIHNAKMKLPFPLCLHIAYQAAKGMNFLHQSDPPIIHCDLKSHNILMDDKWNAKISDFGITRFKSIQKKEQQSSPSSLGTIYWTAPEIFAGKRHSEASDVYSFGIVLWELFHRQTPYDGKEPMLVVMEVQAHKRPAIKPDLDASIRDLMTECWSDNISERPKFDDIMNRLRDLNLQSPLSSYGLHESTHGDAPTGMVYLVATEVSGASDKWDKTPMAMYNAMVLHNKLIRSTVDGYNGFEADFSKNGFTLVFRTLKDVVNWCLSTQTLLVNTHWPEELAPTKFNDNELALHIRIAIHVGVPNCQTDHSGKTVYSGPVADKTKKLLSNASSTTFIIISNPVMEQINKGNVFNDEFVASPFGELMDSARSTDSSKTEKMFEIMPNNLAKYSSRGHTPADAVPNAVVMDIEEMELTHIPSVQRQLSWEIPSHDLKEVESAGKGTIGDYIRTSWKERDVVQKVLLNQQIGEEDILMLKARASVMTKLNHKNLLEFYGVCLEPGKVSLVIKHLPKSGLNHLLYDNSFSLPYNAKVKIAKQIAEGMEYLSNQREHPWLGMHGNLKSANVLVQRDTLTVKLCDFGQGNLKDLARTMTSVGTVAWTAPEILNGEDTTPKITVYSFGIIMWEIYTRHFPYQNEHPIKVVTKIVAGARPPIPGDCPAPYKELMTRCWSAEPEQRPGWGEIVSLLTTMSLSD